MTKKTEERRPRMNKKTVRTGIVGAGFSATFHFEAVNKLYGTSAEVIGVYCRTKERREAFAQKRGIRAFGRALMSPILPVLNRSARWLNSLTAGHLRAAIGGSK